MAKITSKILKSAFVKWKDLKFIQDADFKEMTKDSYRKLRESIITNNFIESFKVWQDGKTIYCLDGYHRIKVFHELEKEGYEIPETFPADFISCRDRKEAGMYVLVYSSIYANITDEGLYGMIHKQQLSIEELQKQIRIPEFDMKRFIKGYFQENTTGDDKLPAYTPVSTLEGDIYEFRGKNTTHRLICGDSTKETTYYRLLKDKRGNLLFTDPPYGINYKYNEHKDKKDGYADLINEAFKQSNQFLKPDAAIYIKQYTHNLQLLFREVPREWKYKNLIIWGNKSQAHPKVNFENAFEVIVLFNDDMEYNLDSVLFMEKGKMDFDKKAEYRLVNWDGFNKLDKPKKSGLMDNLWLDIKALTGGCIRSKESLSDGSFKLHSCQMPAGLSTRGILFSSKPGDTVLDIFAGSGTVIISAEKTGRNAYLIEKDPRYCEVIVNRYRQFMRENNREYKVFKNGKEYKEKADKKAG